jgi:hypothetical protein
MDGCKPYIQPFNVINAYTYFHNTYRLQVTKVNEHELPPNPSSCPTRDEFGKQLQILHLGRGDIGPATPYQLGQYFYPTGELGGTQFPIGLYWLGNVIPAWPIFLPNGGVGWHPIPNRLGKLNSCCVIR